MDNIFVSSQLDRLSRETDDLRKKTSDIEKTQSTMEASIKYLSLNIERLSSSIDKLTESQNKRGFVAFWRENWAKLPTMFVILVGAIYAGNYINDHIFPHSAQYQNRHY